MAVGADWKFANPTSALQKISNDSLDSPSIDHKPVGLELEPNLSFPGDVAGRLSLNVRSALTVTVLNDPSDPDEDGILTAAAVRTADGTLPAQLPFDPEAAYVKYRAEAGIKASAGIPVSSLIGIEAGAEASAVFADYRTHSRAEAARTALIFDLSAGARFATHVSHVEEMKAGEALAFRFGGSLHTTVTLAWSDLFTGQIGTLGKLLGTAAPVAFSFTAGARITAKVRVSDDFVVVFSRIDDDRWRVGARRSRASRVSPSVDAGIEVGFANPAELQGLATAALEGLLGAPAAAVRSMLEARSLEALGPAERKMLTRVAERLGMDEGSAIDAVRSAVEAAGTRITGAIEQVVKTRIALGFSYEYGRVTADSNLLQATLTRDALRQFHADVVRGDLQPLTQALAAGAGGVSLELYLNQKTITRTHAWGFTLGFGKWATIGGKDFAKVETIRRTDIDNRVQESYLGARSYKGSWAGQQFEWGVDLKAEMKAFSAEPLVADYSFGIHLLWVARQESLSGRELEDWLDSAVIWRVLREHDLVDIRARLAAALEHEATCTVQVTIPHTVLLSLLPALSEAPVDAFAAALGAAMPWMHLSPARSSAARRRQVYAPLWASYLRDPSPSQTSFAQAAAEHLRREGHPEMSAREMMNPAGPDALAFAGLTRVNGDTRGACEAFTRGMRILHTSIAAGARNRRTIDKALNEMNDLWVQSHHVRAVGVYLLDAAQRAGVVADVTRTMTVDADQLERSLVVTA
jgi:hypothetical protein